jgi:hypothetical protein
MPMRLPSSSRVLPQHNTGIRLFVRNLAPAFISVELYLAGTNKTAGYVRHSYTMQINEASQHQGMVT